MMKITGLVVVKNIKESDEDNRSRRGVKPNPRVNEPE
jgi:hypothetical protein